MDRFGVEAGRLIVFDRVPERAWAEKIFRRAPSGDGAPVTVWMARNERGYGTA